jgi:NADPH:quinone reductase-like Zn-dependent oxidoreductase
MRAVRYDHHGPASVLQVRTDVPEPVPGPGEVLVRVDFAGLNPIDYKIRDGSSPRAAGLAFPAGTGKELAGTVLDAAADVDLASHGLEAGARAFGMRGPTDQRGTCEDVVAIAADDLAPVPGEAATADAGQGADPDLLPAFGGLALAGLTACSAVEDCARVAPGDTVLVHGGSGGVGQLLIPLARVAGASHIWATGSAANAGRIREVGAEPLAHDDPDHPWDEAIREATDGRGVDVVLDAHYFATFTRSLDVLAPGGRIVELPSLADLTPAKDRGIAASIPRADPSRQRLDRLAALLVAGQLHVEVRPIAPEQVVRAHEQHESGHTRGKLVLDLRA